jgi:hypothetical protein
VKELVDLGPSVAVMLWETGSGKRQGALKSLELRHQQRRKAKAGVGVDVSSPASSFPSYIVVTLEGAFWGILHRRVLLPAKELSRPKCL